MTFGSKEWEQQKEKAIEETLRICQERGILTPFLTEHREQVIEIMKQTFDQEALKELEQQSDTLYGNISESED